MEWDQNQDWDPAISYIGRDLAAQMLSELPRQANRFVVCRPLLERLLGDIPASKFPTKIKVRSGQSVRLPGVPFSVQAATAKSTPVSGLRSARSWSRYQRNVLTCKNMNRHGCSHV